jgi:hypothetical protein
MENVNIKTGGEEHVTDSKQKFNLNDVLYGTVVLPFEDELCVLQKAVENIREIHEDCMNVSDENPILKGTLKFSALIWHMLLNKVYNKAINLLKNEIGKTQDDNKKIEYQNLLKEYNEFLERSEEVLENLNKQHADIMWFGID